MINEKRTLGEFGYTSDTLTQGSHKKVYAICEGCHLERQMFMYKYISTNGRCRKCAVKERNQSGKNGPMYGKHHTKETKCKMSKSKQDIYNGNKNPMYGKHHTKETKRKQSESLCGNKSPYWLGGRKLTNAKYHAKRKLLFGFIPHNKPQKNFHGHHIDLNHVIFIPKELHMSISHSVINDINMDLINNLVCDWYLEYQIVI